MKKSWLYLIASLLFSLLFSLSAAAEVNAADILPDPGNLVNYRGQNNQSFRFYITGDESSGSIWGDGIYTDDSSLSLAAVHSGFLKNGQKGVVTVTILPGQSSYSSSTKNGITSSSYNEWEGSYRIDGAEIADGAIPASGDVIADPGTLSSIEAEINTTLKISLTGDISGRIWGTDIYTDDTTLAVAAVHAGLLRVGQSGILDVTILQGQDSYQGSTKNGITSDSYGSWGRSFKFGTSPAPVQTPAPTTPPAATPTPAPPAPSPTPIPVPDGTVPTSNSIEAFGSGVRLTWGGQALGYRIFRSESETDLGISITDFYITSSRCQCKTGYNLLL